MSSILLRFAGHAAALEQRVQAQGRDVVLGLRLGVGHQRLQPVREALVDLHLQRVVPGLAVAVALVDRGDVGRDREVGPALLDVAGSGQRHVDVEAAEDVGAARAHVADVGHRVPPELALDAHVPHLRRVLVEVGRDVEDGEAGGRRRVVGRERHGREGGQPVAHAAERRERRR